MATRIYHRTDSLTNWLATANTPYGKLASGEIGVATIQNGNSTSVSARLGVNVDPTSWIDCPVIFEGTSSNLELDGTDTRPVVYEVAGTPADGAVVAWDGSQWAVSEEVLRLDAMPTANGTVVWNSSLNKFQVGNVLPANDIDGGSY